MELLLRDSSGSTALQASATIVVVVFGVAACLFGAYAAYVAISRLRQQRRAGGGATIEPGRSSGASR